MVRSPILEELLSARIREGDFPSASYLVGEKGEAVLAGALGSAALNPTETPASTGTVYDLASLTKVLVTGLLLAQLFERGELSPDRRVSDVLPELSGTDKADITVRQLAAHTSGLEAWYPLYLSARPGSEPAVEALRIISERPLACGPDSKAVYSDQNFILLGMILERVCAAPLDRIARDGIFAPLGLEDTFFNPPASRTLQTAASEQGNLHERNACRDLGLDADAYGWRTGVIRGEVHDGNCFFLGGVAGHAGLFSDAAGVFKIALQFLPSTCQVIRPETCSLFRTDLAHGSGEARSLAFQLASSPDSTASDALSPESFGHLGFTGTSVWIDPAAERIYILLTNRTHGRTPPFVNINSVRRAFNSSASAELDSR